MGKTSHKDPGQFASELRGYLTYLIEANGKNDLSGRWLEVITDGARKRDYWSKLVKGVKDMTTNDIDVVAAAFGIASPFDYVRFAHELAENGSAPKFIVGTHDEDFEISDDPGPRAAAAKRKPTPGN